MAAAPQKPICIFFFLIFTAALVLHIAQGRKQTKIVFYMHQDLYAQKPSDVVVAGRLGSSTSVSNFFEFGTVVVADIPLTEGPEKESKQVGRLKGTYMNTELDDGKGFFMAVSAVFTDDGEFKGSTLQIQGSELILAEHREFGVVTGTGYFRFVKGYAIMETVALDFDKLTCLTKVSVTVKHDDDDDDDDDDVSQASVCSSIQ